MRELISVTRAFCAAAFRWVFAIIVRYVFFWSVGWYITVFFSLSPGRTQEKLTVSPTIWMFVEPWMGCGGLGRGIQYFFQWTVDHICTIFISHWLMAMYQTASSAVVPQLQITLLCLIHHDVPSRCFIRWNTQYWSHSKMNAAFVTMLQLTAGDRRKKKKRQERERERKKEKMKWMLNIKLPLDLVSRQGRIITVFGITNINSPNVLGILTLTVPLFYLPVLYTLRADATHINIGWVSCEFCFGFGCYSTNTIAPGIWNNLFCIFIIYSVAHFYAHEYYTLYFACQESIEFNLQRRRNDRTRKKWHRWSWRQLRRKINMESESLLFSF